MQYTYKYQKSRKLSPTVTRMANVIVFNDHGKEIGNYAMSNWEKVEDCVKMLVREYELRKAFAKM